ncbi:hypothetical protein [Herbaspirillum huttiense]|uniref:hypothetical protein n=1 Tax=Herbaspirillum huttiense TaxID=863372 RepID=UPI003B3BC1FA
MRTTSDIANYLLDACETLDISEEELVHRSGLEPHIVAGVLNGEADYSITLLVTILDATDCEMLICPKVALRGIESPYGEFVPAEPKVKTKVQIAMDKLRKTYEN